MGSRTRLFHAALAIALHSPAFAWEGQNEPNRAASVAGVLNCDWAISRFGANARSTIRSIANDLERRNVPPEKVRKIESDFQALLEILKPERPEQRAEFDQTLAAVFALRGRYSSEETFEGLARSMSEARVSRFFSSMAAGLGQGPLSDLIETIRRPDGRRTDSEAYTRILRAINNPIQILEIKSVAMLLLEFVNRAGSGFDEIGKCAGVGAGISDPLLSALLAGSPRPR